MVDVVQHEKLDLLHVHYAIPHASAAYMAKQILKTKRIEIPVVTTLHGTDITLAGKDPSFEPVVTFSINQSDVVTAVSKSLKDDTYAHFDIIKEIEVIPNFIDLNKFTKLKKDHFKKAICPNDEKLVVHTSNFRKVKRIDDVIKIFEIIHKIIPSKLLLIGDGPERAMAENLCRELQICQDVRFLGKLEQVEEVLSVADLFLLPSESESFGLSALEAFACEVPVISSNAGGIPELNINGVTGYLSDVGNYQEMAANAIHILKPENLSNFKKAALARAKEFELGKILPMYEKVYQKAMSLELV
jgi:N-acetyl-alpha-D-glucosaminyl L-malate synthase BshA